MTDSVLFQAFVYLCAAVVFVPIARRLGLGAVLGYLLAGVAIGPDVLGLVAGGHTVMHFAEFGVVIMLFLVGLELRPALLWKLRRPVLGLGGLDVLVTTGGVAAVAVVAGVPWHTALALGMIASMSSTAIVLATLSERGLLRTAGGQAAFSILLFEDVAVIPILAIFPLLALPEAVDVAGAAGAAASSDGGRPAWQAALLLFAALGGVIVGGRYVVRPMFHALARARLHEVFTAAALMLVVGVALAMQQVGLSPALGTFLAGVLLAESEYRHELVSDVEPFKGLLLGLFFITVGAQIDLRLLVDEPLIIAGGLATIIAVKLAGLHLLGRVFGLERPARWLLAVSLTQAGEFGFVLLSFGAQHRVFDPETVRLVTPIVACSMVVTPLFFAALERWILPAVTDATVEARPADAIPDGDAQVIIAGFGRFGQVVGRLLRASGVPLTILDQDPAVAEMVARVGIKVHYGDASRSELLRAAGCEKARVFVVAVDDHDQAMAIVRAVQHHFPHLTILARAHNRAHYFELRALGVRLVHREQFAAAFELGVDALRALGVRAYTAHRRAHAWRVHEHATLEALAADWGKDDARYFARWRAAHDEAEALLREDEARARRDRDAAWDAAPRRADSSTDSDSSD